MRRIIVPADFSDAAWNAFLFAVRLADKLQAEILILNAYQAPHGGATTMHMLDNVLKKDSEKGMEKWLAKVETSGVGNKVKVEGKSVHLGLVEALNSQMKEHDEHMIIMGSVGETGTLEKLIGSNASDVVAKAKCPVFVIPPGTEFSSMDRIVYAVDFDHVPEKEDLDLLKDLAKLNLSAKLDAVRVRETKRSEDDLKASIDALLHDIPHNQHIISGNDISDALDAYVSQSQSDLLVLVKKKKGFLEKIFQENVIKDLAHTIRTPLLILKAQQE